MSGTSVRKTLDQIRAERAWEHTKELKGEPADDFAAVSKQTCSRILNAGLGPALAFSAAKSNGGSDRKGAHGKLLGALDEHLSSLGIIRTGNTTDMVLRVMAGDAARLRRATDEALAFLTWVSRFADARKPPKKKQEEDENEDE